MAEQYMLIDFNTESNSASGYSISLCDLDAPLSMTISSDALTRYLITSDQEAATLKNKLLENPPSVGAIVQLTLKVPGLRARERATDLLSALPFRTMHFAYHFTDSEFLFRSFYATKIWSLVIGALGNSDGDSVGAAHHYLSSLLDSPNSSKRLAAFDALEALDDTNVNIA